MKEQLGDLTHSGIARLDKNLQEELVGYITDYPIICEALAPLRLFETLPARETWHRFLPDIPPPIDHLLHAVGKTLLHQSEEATDCRWFRLMALVLSGKVRIPHKMAEVARQLFAYSTEGDQSSTSASIRAAEIVIGALSSVEGSWSSQFWDEGWKKTRCIALVKHQDPKPIDVAVTRNTLTFINARLEEHWTSTHSTTAVNPKHDAIFGMAFYCLRILEELMGIGIAVSVLGRLGLRTIFETRVNLKYLLLQDNPDLWKNWRLYGAGQAKLSALKFEEGIEPPKFIDIESIEDIAGEDIWEEYLSISLASWSGLDLRKLSEKADLKVSYDKHYSWTSAYAHGMWGAVRESCFQTCGNPLHRLHRYPERQMLADTLSDAVALVDEALTDLSEMYPDFDHRLQNNPRGSS